MEFEKGKLYSVKDLEENGCVYCKHTTAVMFYRKATTLYVFDKNANDKKEYKLLTIMMDQFDNMH
jgi:hypothetical protein